MIYRNTSLKNNPAPIMEPKSTRYAGVAALSYSQLNTLGRMILKGKKVFHWVKSLHDKAPPPISKSSQVLYSLFPMLAVIFPSWKNNPPVEIPTPAPTNSTIAHFQEAYSEVKSGLDSLQELPVMEQIRDALVVKQTADFSITLANWVLGKSSSFSLLSQGINTALIWSPKVIAALSAAGYDNLVAAATFTSGLCLTFSLMNDAFTFLYPKVGEPSPTMKMASSVFHLFTTG